MVIDKIIGKLWKIESKPVGTYSSITRNEIIYLCSEAKKILLSQPILLELYAPMTICGDLHAQYHDMLRIFRQCGLPPTSNYIFLGDYVDRGQNNIETMMNAH